jgi:hypothetical protein
VIYVRRTVGVVVGLGVLCCVLACGGAMKQIQQAAQDSLEMTQLGQFYHSYANDPANKGVGPASADEWVNWAKKTNLPAESVAIIEKCKPGGKYTFYWGVKVSMPNSSSTVLGYDNKLPGAQGVAVMVDGSVRAMQPAEFNAAPKPPKDGAKDADKDKAEKDKDKK